MPTITATPGSATANSFLTIAEFIAYLDGRLNASAATDADLGDQEKALVEATRELTVLEWTGTRTDATQALSWPRQYAVDPDAPIPVDPADPGWPVYFGDDVIPTRIKNGTAELALEFLRAGSTDIAKPDADEELVRRRIDVIEHQWTKPSRRRRGLARYPRVLAWIGPLLDGSRVGGLDVVRV